MQLRSSFWIRSILALALLIAAPTVILAIGRARLGSHSELSLLRSGTPPVQPAAFGKLPLAFEGNQGQAPAEVNFLARSRAANVFLTDAGAVFTFRHGTDDSQMAALRMNLRTASRIAPIGLEELSGKANYFIGDERSKWHTGVSMFRKVKCADVYPGIDLVYYGNQQQLEYDFVVRPGADPNAIRWTFEGADAIELGSTGDLIVKVGGNEVRQRPARVYQNIGKQRRELRGSYLLASAQEVGFEIEGYDRTQPLVIDPVLLFSTFAGGSAEDYGRGIAVDAAGVYVVGATFSTNFPLAAPRQSASGGNFDAFVLKLNPTGSALIYATYLGGSGGDYGSAIAVDGSGSAYVTGWTTSTNFPTASPLQGSRASSQDSFVAKLSPTGSALLYSTYLGGNDDDFARAIAVDGSGNAYVAGSTRSTDFPTANPYQAANGGLFDAFISKINPSGSGFLYSTYLGGTLTDEANGIAVDSTGAAYLVGTTISSNFPRLNPFRSTPAGSEAFVTKLSSSGLLAYSTYLGGASNDFGYGIAVDSAGSAIVVGQTASSDFPISPQAPAPNPAFQQNLSGSSDGFVTKLSPAGSTLVYSTFLGGTSSDTAYAVAVDGSGNAFVTGDTLSINFPTVGSLQLPGGDLDVFVTELNALGSMLTYSTYLAGAGEDSARAIALDSTGNAYVTGQTRSGNFPTSANAVQASSGGGLDAFIAKVGPSSAVLLSSVDPSTAPTAGGTTISLRGANFMPGATATVGGTAATNVVVVTGGTITAKAPAHALGAVDVVVTNPDSQTSTLAGGFTYADPPPPGGPNGNGKGCGAAGSPIGAWLALAAFLRRYLLARRRDRRES